MIWTMRLRNNLSWKDHRISSIKYLKFLLKVWKLVYAHCTHIFNSSEFLHWYQPWNQNEIHPSWEWLWTASISSHRPNLLGSSRRIYLCPFFLRNWQILSPQMTALNHSLAAELFTSLGTQKMLAFHIFTTWELFWDIKAHWMNSLTHSLPRVVRLQNIHM